MRWAGTSRNQRESSCTLDRGHPLAGLSQVAIRIHRGNNRQACFFADEDYRFYLDWLAEHAGNTGCQIHAYVLMPNHVHLLLSAETAQTVGALNLAHW